MFKAGDFPLSVYMGDSRYRVFAKSLVCCRCGLVGSIMRLEYNWHPKGWIEPHFNLYAPDGEGGWVLMTQDHILPKSKGGSDEDDNLITMCSYCNGKKGNKISVQNRVLPGILKVGETTHESLRQPDEPNRRVVQAAYA